MYTLNGCSNIQLCVCGMSLKLLLFCEEGRWFLPDIRIYIMSRLVYGLDVSPIFMYGKQVEKNKNKLLFA